MASKYDIPTVVIIRNPLDAIVSLLIRENFLYEWVAIKTYIMFYEMAKKEKSKFVVAPFEMITSEPQMIIDRLNVKFDKSFNNGRLTDDLKSQLFNFIDRINSSTGKDEKDVSRPSKLKDDLKKKIVDKVSSHRLFPTALNLYNDFRSYE